MNDRYLFKAKRVDNGKWVQGYYYQIWENGYILWGMTNDVPNMIVTTSDMAECLTSSKEKRNLRAGSVGNTPRSIFAKFS